MKVRILAKGLPIMVEENKYAKYGDVVDMKNEKRAKSLIEKRILEVVEEKAAPKTAKSKTEKGGN